MHKNKLSGISKIFDEYMRRVEEDARLCAKKAGEIIQKGYEDGIAAFYGDYKPRSYVRTLNSRLGSSGFKHKRLYRYVGNNSWEGGIIVDSGYIPEYEYGKWSVERIFYNTFYIGEHGFSIYEKSRTMPTPRQMTLDAYNRAKEYCRKHFLLKWSN